MKKLLFVYNPRSGKGLIRSQLSTIVEMFSAAAYDVTVYPTKMAMDGCMTVQNRAEEFDLIVCSGGDGTLDEVVTGLMNSGIRRLIGYIPAGSTNDFAVSVGIPKSMEMAARAVVDGTTFSCDLGKMNEDYFVYVAAFGLFTDVSYQTPQDLKNMLGHAAYLLEGMKRVGTWKTWNLQIKSEEFSGEGEFVFGMITNSSSVGGIKGITGKNVEMNDGLFEVMLVRAPKSIMHLQEIITAMVSGKDSDNSLVRFKTKKLEISSETPVAWTRDGENGGEHTCVVLENLQQAFEILVKNSPETQSIDGLTDGAAETAVTMEPMLTAGEADALKDNADGSADEENALTDAADGSADEVNALADAADRSADEENALTDAVDRSADEENALADAVNRNADEANALSDDIGRIADAADRIAGEADVFSESDDTEADAEGQHETYYKELTGNILALGSGMPVSVEQIIQALEHAFSEIAAEFTSKLQKD